MTTPLAAGDTAPDFTCATLKTPRFLFDTAAGRYLVLCFFGSAGLPAVRKRISVIRRRPDLFNDDDFATFGITIDPADKSENRIGEQYPGHRVFLDFDRKVSELYGLFTTSEDGKPGYEQTWFVLDPGLRIMKVLPFRPDGSDLEDLLSYLESLPLPPSSSNGLGVEAPILMLPNVFEPELCQRLIQMYHEIGSEESGFMVEDNGKTVGSYDFNYKRRQDATLTDKAIIRATTSRIMRRVVPQIQKAHMFTPTRIERFIVAHYGSDDGGHFRPHRDNTTTATQHRRFAVSINLNDDFEGGGVGFPEYGRRFYAPPAGGAVIFSCALLHTVSKVTRGDRYAFLPFLYDEEGRKLRDQSAGKLVPGSAESLAELMARQASGDQSAQQ